MLMSYYFLLHCWASSTIRGKAPPLPSWCRNVLWWADYDHSTTTTLFTSACLAYKPYFFNQRTIFFPHTKSNNSTFIHGWDGMCKCKGSHRICSIHMHVLNGQERRSHTRFFKFSPSPYISFQLVLKCKYKECNTLATHFTPTNDDEQYRS